MYGINNRVEGGRVGGIGKGIRISKSGAGNRVEGTTIIGVVFINQGANNIAIGPTLAAQVTACILDQATSVSLDIQDSADGVQVFGNAIYGGPPHAGIGIYVAETAGHGTQIVGNQIWYHTYGIVVNATVGSRVQNVIISDNVFSDVSDTALILDSVGNCIVTGNRDKGTPSGGSWSTKNTNAGAASYTFDNNRWHTAAPGQFHTGATYSWGNDTGIVAINSGKNQPGGAATSLVINHGLFRTPSAVLVTPEGVNGGFQIASLTSTQFTIAWATSGTPQWHWQAKV